MFKHPLPIVGALGLAVGGNLVVDTGKGLVQMENGKLICQHKYGNFFVLQFGDSLSERSGVFVQGDVIGDLNSRRGRIEGMEARNGAQVINAFVPLSEMFGYATDLRSKTQGRGNYSMEVDHYEDVPRNIAEAIIAKNKGTQA